MIMFNKAVKIMYMVLFHTYFKRFQFVVLEYRFTHNYYLLFPLPNNDSLLAVDTCPLILTTWLTVTSGE